MHPPSRFSILYGKFSTPSPLKESVPDVLTKVAEKFEKISNITPHILPNRGKDLFFPFGLNLILGQNFYQIADVSGHGCKKRPPCKILQF